MCLDLRNGNFNSIKEVEYLTQWIPNITNEELVKANTDKEAYNKLMKEAEDGEVFSMLY